MFTTQDLENYAERYAEENSSPFAVPDEFDLDYVENTDCFRASAAVLGSVGSPADSRTDSQSLENGREPGGDRAKPAEDGQAPADNIGPAKYHLPRNWGGYDGGCEASFMGEWDPNFFEGLTQRLDLAKQAADDGDAAASYIKFGGFVWLVRATGAGVGYFKYKWVLESHGVKLYIHSNPKTGIPAVCVRFGFECLARTDLFKAVDTLKDCLAMEGFLLKEEKISRVDMQVLLPVHISEFVSAMTAGPRICTRCRGGLDMYSNLKTGKVETITVRSENCELCIYDKHAQVMQSDPVYYETFCKCILGDEFALVPKELTRVEFRFRRGFLRRYGVETFEDLRNSAAALLEIASRDWFRILERDKVRGSENEIADAPIWKRTREAFDYYFRETRSDQRTREGLKKYKPIPAAPALDRLIKQGMGCLASAASYVLEKVFDAQQLVQYYSEVVAAEAENTIHKVIDRQIFNEVVRQFTHSPKPDYETVEDIQEGLAPLGFPEFWQYAN